MTAMIVIGTAMTVAGLAGLVWCIRKARWLKGADLDADATRTVLSKLVFVHMAAIGGAFLGLGLVLVGVILA